MPIVHVFLWEGRKDEEIKEMVKKLTKVFVDMGIPENAVEILVHDVPKTRWAIGGEFASEKFRNI
ncbi:MAG: tautomerase family protein [Thermoplasmatales archaeon]|nr:tautomerase family protein [Thermoplasmatales archaeon]